ncbi:unnamed protein product [Linum tenue]|uniref:Uncharacterized protein n=1 Tax=Linum tenue TaxID=586396 RepID=A0AAV0IUL2_9ROSI|nr:unnamed protein product [Linum tenue]
MWIYVSSCIIHEYSRMPHYGIPEDRQRHRPRVMKPFS